MAEVKLSFDDEVDVLYARLEGSEIVDSRESDSDFELVLNFDKSGKIVGIQLIGARVIPDSVWATHPARALLPPEILNVVDRWKSGGSIH